MVGAAVPTGVEQHYVVSYLLVNPLLSISGLNQSDIHSHDSRYVVTLRSTEIILSIGGGDKVTVITAQCPEQDTRPRYAPSYMGDSERIVVWPGAEDNI